MVRSIQNHLLDCLLIGGRYVMERTANHIKIWFWPRTSDDVPSDIVSGSSNINPKRWVNVLACWLSDWATDLHCQGTPAAYFPDTFCNIDSRFQEHNIIINLTFCEQLVTELRAALTLLKGGDWAGSVYGASGCPSTCEGKLIARSRPLLQVNVSLQRLRQ